MKMPETASVTIMDKASIHALPIVKRPAASAATRTANPEAKLWMDIDSDERYVNRGIPERTMVPSESGRNHSSAAMKTSWRTEGTMVHASNPERSPLSVPKTLWQNSANTAKAETAIQNHSPLAQEMAATAADRAHDTAATAFLPAMREAR